MRRTREESPFFRMNGHRCCRDGVYLDGKLSTLHGAASTALHARQGRGFHKTSPQEDGQ